MNKGVFFKSISLPVSLSVKFICKLLIFTDDLLWLESICESSQAWVPLAFWMLRAMPWELLTALCLGMVSILGQRLGL